MADSDEEYDRKKRDKFRRERSDYSSDRRRNEHDKRPSWREEYYEARRRSRDDDSDRERRGYMSSPPHREWSPPGPKRFRRGGWESIHDMSNMGMMPPGGHFGMMDRRGPWMMPTDMPPRGGHINPGSRPIPAEMMMGFNPMADSRQRGGTLLTFKQFLTQQDDNIDDTEAIRLYHEYKADYKKKQLHQFFNDHKEEDWFLSKYHPKYVSKMKQESLANLKNRLEVFEILIGQGKIKSIPMTVEQGDDIVRLMDTAVIYMEGGTEFDLKALEINSEEKTEDVSEREEKQEKELKEEEPEEKTDTAETESGDKPSFMLDTPTPEQMLLVEKAKEYQRQRSSSDNGDTENVEKRQLKRPRNDSDDESTSPKRREGDESLDSNNEPPPPGLEPEPEIENLPPPVNEEMTEPEPEPEPETGQAETGGGDDDDVIMASSTTHEENVPSSPPKPCPLHLTKAIYIRHVTPQIAPSDLLEICKIIPGYLRMAFAEPQPDRGYERRGWITYRYDTNIKDACIRIGAAKIKNSLLICQINRDLTRRVKNAPPVTWARRVVQSDVQLLLNLIEFLDKKGELWNYSTREGEGEGENASTENKEPTEETLKPNPLIEIAQTSLSKSLSAVTAGIATPSSGNGEGTIEDGEEDEEGVIEDPGTEILTLESPLVQMLDCLIWYLRLVHSLDYYNGTVFPDEDCMPHRCGIITARPSPPNAVTNEEVTEHIKSMEVKVQPLLKVKTELDDEELEKLGRRDHESEVEKFIDVNTQKLGENKYLCPLSGKKFRGPEFVRKHILNKHMAAVEEVKSETDFFNNYLKDPDRPVPLDTVSGGGGVAGGGEEDKGGGRNVGSSSGAGNSWNGSDQMMQGYPDVGMGMRRGMRGGRPFRGRGDRRGKRFVRHYNDLDMPSDMY